PSPPPPPGPRPSPPPPEAAFFAGFAALAAAFFDFLAICCSDWAAPCPELEKSSSCSRGGRSPGVLAMSFRRLRISNVGPTPRGVILLGLSRAMVRRRTPARKKRTVSGGRREAMRLHVGPALGGSPAKKSNIWVLVVLAGLVLVNLYVFVWDKKTSVAAIKQKAQE